MSARPVCARQGAAGSWWNTSARMTVAQATPPSGMMGQGMMQPRMMGHGMMGRSGHVMKIMFAVPDVNGDGALSFEEVTTIHKRIFDRVDVNRDGKVTPEAAQSFMRD